MKSVEFIRAWPPYNRGEVAGFDDKTAGRLIDGGFARSKSPSGSAKAAAGSPADRQQRRSVKK